MVVGIALMVLDLQDSRVGRIVAAGSNASRGRVLAAAAFKYDAEARGACFIVELPVIQTGDRE
jgi:hypothetical protein